MQERSVIHLNVADFAVALESRVDNRLRKRPVVIAPGNFPRAAVYDLSEEAYQAGIRKGMILPQVRRLCRDALVIPPRRSLYERGMKALIAHAAPYSPLIEATDIQGHLFLDATGTGRLFGRAVDVAERIRREVIAALGINPIWSVASNKLMAKIGSRMVKPAGEYWVRAGEETAILKNLPLCLLPGLEADDLKKLSEYRLSRVGEVAAWTLGQLSTVFGSEARAGHLYESVRGIDLSPILPAGQAPSEVTAEHEFSEDTNDAGRLRLVLRQLAEDAGQELRRRRLAARRIGLVLDYSDGMRCIRQTTLAGPTANDFALFDACLIALERAWLRRVRVRHVRMVCDRLGYPSGQLDLWEAEDTQTRRREGLVSAVDRIRGRFGRDAIYLGIRHLRKNP